MEYSSTTNTTTTVIPTTSAEPTGINSDHYCKLVLHTEIPNTRIRGWDALILVANSLFLLFLILRFRRVLLRLRATNSPISITFYCLVCTNVIVSILRCIVSMVVNSSSSAGGYADLILWVIVKFFLLMMEICVVTYGLAFGRLDTWSNVRYVLIITFLISLLYAIIQGAFELLAHDDNFIFESPINKQNMMLFGHGGVLFISISSFIFALFYLIITILPWTRLRDKISLPVSEERSYFYFVALLALLNSCYVISGGLLTFGVQEGICVMDVATLVYFVFVTPTVCYIFVKEYFQRLQPGTQFSYTTTPTERADEEDDVSLPHHQSLSSIKTDSEYIYQTNSFFENTQFNETSPVNPLYVASLQSPDSITGYSLDSQIIDIPTTSSINRENDSFETTHHNRGG